ncbi:MAG: diguanylate cyclase/phosphodiesterase (GGDEF & EAL domains) with PAS/PAC sensor(s) [uncultured Gemmatimonadetes bacterium]|uniref:histidine kinase n=1 Tax=uncultured Gemmatimonadota bacterium TaxID=203437 RepID=A0A6J4KQL7_9BACT|nr:MAG: diguanylate cyclase/phosphodiesterase (GGDEF & EAL domains) with PAS/PAC sensor(s) [uncultured Gemmatimonadota bacterium]
MHPLSLSHTPVPGELEALRAELAAARQALEAERAARIRAEEALRERDSMLDEVEGLAQLGTWEWNTETDVIRWSPEQMRIHGLPSDGGTQSFADFLGRVHPDDRARVVEECERLMATGESFLVPYRVVRPDGGVREMNALGKLLPDASGKWVRMVGTAQDVTERNRADRALRASEARFRDLFEQFPHSVQVLSPEGETLQVNPAFDRLWGLRMDELAGYNPLRDPRMEPIRDLLRRGFAGERVTLPEVEFDTRGMHAEVGGQPWPRWIRSFVFAVRDDGGAVREVVLVHEDVTEQRRAEQALTTSEESYRTIFDSSSDAIFVTDPATGQVVDANRAACTMADATIEELRADAGAVIWNGPPPYTAERAHEQMLLAAEGVAQRFEWLSIHPRTGAEIWGEVSLQRVTLGGELRVLALVRDIGERKRAEQALRGSEQSYRALFELSNDAIYVHDVETGAILDANRKAYEAAGLSSVEELRERGMQFIAGGEAPFTPDMAMEYVRRAAAGEPQRFEWRTGAPAGGQVWSEVSLNRVTINGVERLLATARDITERKQAEQALRASEESYRTVFDSTAAAIWVYDPDTGDLLDVNAAACELYGRDAREQKEIGLEGLMWGEAPYTLDEVQRIFARARGGEPQRFVWLGRHRGGGEVWAEVQARRVAGLGGDRLLVTARGMNEWRAAADALRRANEELEARVAERTAELAAANVALEEEVAEHEAARDELVERTRELEGVFQALPDLYFRMGPDGTITDHRAGRAAALHSPVPDFRGRRMEDVLPEGTAAHFAAAFDEAGRTGGMVCVEYALEVEGESRNFEARVVPLEDGSRITVVRDITERKTAEAELLRQKAYFEEVIGSLESGVAVFDRELRYEYCSPSTIRDPEVRAWAIGRTIEEYGRRIGLPEEVIRRRTESLARTAAERATGEFEEEIRGPDGGKRHMLRRGLPVLDERGELVRIIGYSVDITERKRAEEALQEREERFRTLIENAHDIITILDREGRVVYQSPSVQRIMGYPPADLIGTSAFDLVHPDDVPQVLEAMAAIVAAPGRMARAEYRYRHRDGTWRRLETFGRALPEGSVEGAAVFNSRDVTERWEADQALQRSEEHFRALIENAHDLTVIIDASGRFVYQSPSMERIYGRPRNETLGHTAWELMHPDDVPAVAAEFERVLAEPGRIGHVEYRYRHADGHWVYTEAFGRTLVPGSAVQGVVVNARDVTERRLAEEAIRDQEERLRFALEAGRMGAWEWDVANGRVKWSPILQEINGLEPGTFEETPEAALARVHPDDKERASSLVRDALERGGEYELQYRVVWPDGGVHWLESKGRAMEDPVTGATRMVGVCTDITERMRAEEALRRATQEAERANRAKSEFLSRMSHELRTPMNSILGFAQVLGRAGLTEAHNKYLQHILKGGRHLLNLINEVLEISRIEAGRQSLSLEPVHVRTVLQEALGLVRPLAEQRRVELDDAPWVADDEAYVYADRQRLTQVVLNLLSNAVKYNRPGGRVRLWCATEPGEEAGGPWVRVRIEDTGPGIPANRADQLFTPFARLGAEQTEVEGTGLGLALSLRLAEAMGGDLVLESSGNAGSVFRLELRPAENPVNRAEDSALAPPAPGELPRRAARVLYIEDNLANLALVETFLMPRPEWQTIPALQGLVGLEMAREHQPDLVLLDLHLPDMHGSEVLRRLRADARTSRIPVVVISADATHTAVQELMSAGADAYLTKPLDLDEFLRTLEQFLPEAAA